MTTGHPEAPPPLPSVYDADPVDLGGISARQGFAYQDEVAASFYLEMLSDDNLIEVSCETYDDILLIRQRDSTKFVEYVQVKGEHPDQLWTIPMLCGRTKTTRVPDGIGSSILERSLARDRCREPSWFRIVTCRQIHSDLGLLTRPRKHEHRSESFASFKALADDVGTRIGGFKSKKGNDSTYWLINVLWQVTDESSISRINRELLTGILHSLDHPYDPDTVKTVYNNLRALAKDTAELGIDKWKEKRISRDGLLSRIRQWLDPYPDKLTTERLDRKLSDAGLDPVCQSVARVQRHNYLKKLRTSAYLSSVSAEDCEHDVLSVLHNLRSSLDSGRIVEGGVEFHDRCLRKIASIPSSPSGARSVPISYLTGCMYEITARCRHRFTRIRL